MQIQSTKLRKMGFQEKITVLFHELAAGSTSVSAMINIGTIIEFEQFKEAWQILFQRQPLLRAVVQTEEQDCFFNFEANFDNIPLKHIKDT